MSAVLVLGAGQVGTFVARELVERGAVVVVADSLPSESLFVRFGPPDVDLACADILDEPAIARLIRRWRVDSVVLAAGVTAELSRADPARAWAVNARGPAVVARAAIAAGAVRLVFVSSFAVYGRPSRGPIFEAAPLRPRSVYGRSKAAAESAVLSIGTDRLGVRIVRPCAVYGPSRPGFGSQSTRLIDRLIVAGLGDNGEATTTMPAVADEYIYVKDLARALSLVTLDDRVALPTTFNVGSGSVTDPRGLHRALVSVFPRCADTLEPPALAVNGHAVPLDITRVRKVFGFRPRYDLARGLADYVQTTRLA